MRRTKEEAELTKKEIVSASIKVMNEKGIALTRFEDIAHEANVTRGAIYHYFKSKNEILFAIHESNKKKLFDLFEKHISDNIDPLSSLQRGLKEIFYKFENDLEFKSTEMLFLKAEFNNLLVNDENLREIFISEMKKTIGRLTELVKRGQTEGSIRNDIKTNDIVNSLISFYAGFISTSYLEKSEFKSGLNSEKYIEIIIDGIKS